MTPGIFMDNFERTTYSDEMFGILGRALTYSCRFENICKAAAALRQIKINRHIFESKTDYDKLIKQIYAKNLSKTIESFSSEKIRFEVFEKARKARNEIVHEAALSFDCCLDELPCEIVSQTISTLKPLVTDIATADFLLCFLTSLETHVPLPIFRPNDYVEKVMRWVFEPNIV